MFHVIIALGAIGAVLGIITQVMPNALISNLALISLGVGLTLLGVAVKKVVDGLKALMAPKE